jgi:cytochrome P450
LSIVARTLFNSDVSDHTSSIGEAMRVVQENATRASRQPVQLPTWVPTRRNRRGARARLALNEIIMRVIGERRASGQDMGDLLSMLLLAMDEDDGGQMTDKQVRDEAMTLFLAGHDTTANALTWTWYLLSQNPEAEARLHAELDSVLGGRVPTLDDLPKLRYTVMVVKESMRIYSPAWITSREAIDDVTINGYPIKKGSLVFVSPDLTHHDPHLFPEPEKFIPERFSEENEKKLPRYAYFPFGGGPRICIGQQFAMMEAALLLATIAQRYRLSLVPGHPVEMEPLITLRTRYGLRMNAAQRTTKLISVVV